MEKRKIESLRDLAIAHFPKAREKRAQAIRLHGDRFADSGLQNAYSFGNPEATAVEKQAIELLKLTFMHPNARPEHPFTWDTVEDAECIAAEARVMEGWCELLPQLEAEMLDAARLLCVLTGAAQPPWVDAADAPAAKVVAKTVTTPAPVVTTNKLRRNNLDPAIDKAIKRAGNMELADVYLELKGLALDDEKPFTGQCDGDALCYTNDNNNPAKLNKDALGKRLKNRR